MIALVTNSNLKIYLIVILTGIAIWLYKDYTFQKAENKRQTENIRQIQLQDSLKYAQLEYSKHEIENYLNYQNQELKAALANHKIKLKNIQRIVSQELQYKDTTNKTTSLNPIVNAIRHNKPIKFPIKDSTNCLTITGHLAYEADSLTLNITERNFKNKTDIVAHLERRQWKFLGIKTRFLGKKQAVIKTFDECGNSKTLIIDKNQE